jgi:hypothetical protein
MTVSANDAAQVGELSLINFFPVTLAISKDNDLCLTYLLEFGADVTLTNNNGFNCKLN